MKKLNFIRKAKVTTQKPKVSTPKVADKIIYSPMDIDLIRSTFGNEWVDIMGFQDVKYAVLITYITYDGFKIKNVWFTDGKPMPSADDVARIARRAKVRFVKK